MAPRAEIIFAICIVVCIWSAIEIAVLIGKKSRWPREGHGRSFFVSSKRMYMPEDGSE